MNPTDKRCWVACSACHRCADKGRYAKCASCSGRYDPLERLYPDPDDVCDCRNGILRWKTQKGQLIVARFPGNPFKGNVQGEAQTMDERDWEAYLQSEREKRNNEHWNPIQITA